MSNIVYRPGNPIVPSYVPSQYSGDVLDAASQLNIPVAVVAAQINLESGFNPNARSSAGAEGIAQFEPGTFASYGPKGGSPFNAKDSFIAYVNYMKYLLRKEGGDIRNALAAYNAGPGNIAAGQGYATTILDKAGSKDIKVTTPSGGTTKTSSSSSLIPSSITNFFASFSELISGTTDSATSLLSVFKAFFQPSTYIRIGAGLFGFLALIFTIILLYKESKSNV